jgi:hypothetical protein
MNRSSLSSVDKSLVCLALVCFSKHFTNGIADQLFSCIKTGGSDRRSSILNEMQDVIAREIAQGTWDGDHPSSAAGLLYLWENVLQSCEMAEEIPFAAAMVDMLLMAIDSVCCHLADSYSLLEHYKQYEQLGVLGKLVRAAVARLQPGTTGTIEERSRALRVITNRIGKVLLTSHLAVASVRSHLPCCSANCITAVQVVDHTARFPLLAALLHATVRDILG